MGHAGRGTVGTCPSLTQCFYFLTLRLCLGVAWKASTHGGGGGGGGTRPWGPEEKGPQVSQKAQNHLYNYEKHGGGAPAPKEC